MPSTYNANYANDHAHVEGVSHLVLLNPDATGYTKPAKRLRFGQRDLIAFAGANISPADAKVVVWAPTVEAQINAAVTFEGVSWSVIDSEPRNDGAQVTLILRRKV